MPVPRTRARKALEGLLAHYPDARCALSHDGPWQLLCATILSAQCTDERVNLTTPGLFARYPDAAAMAAADPEELSALIKSTGFFREKARSLISMSQDVVDRFGGEVPRALEDLITMRGVGRKTANVIIGAVYGGDAVVVDTHVKRLANRLGWVEQTDPDKIERDLMALFPRKHWTALAHTLIIHGRTLCDARKPKCGECPVSDFCPEGRQRMAAGS